MKKWKCVDSEIVYDSKYFKVRKDTVELPDGDKKEWTYWDSADSAMVLGMTIDRKLIMIEQYRYMVGDTVVEFPSGHSHLNEPIEASACREFEEETGYKCESLEKLGAFYETYGQLNRKIHIYYSDKVVKTKQKLDEDTEINEDISVKLVDFDTAVKMATENKILAMGSALAILLLKEKL